MGAGDGETSEPRSFCDAKDPRTYAERFAASSVVGSRYLALRDVPALVKEYAPPGAGDRVVTLDYGCGAAVSTAYLESHGVRPVDGVDVSPHMIEQARRRDPAGHYRLIESGRVPAPDRHYDCVTACLVLMYVATKDELARIFAEAARILKPDGCFVAVVADEAMFCGGGDGDEWVGFDVNFAQNREARSGARVKVLLTEMDMMLPDLYYWTVRDYEEVCERSGLAIVRKHWPLGRDDDGFPWVREKVESPFVVLVMKKKTIPVAVEIGGR